MQKFKIRASAISQIMGDSRGGITEKQQKTLSELEQKEKLTEKQQKTLSELREKANKPIDIPETAKTYCKKWVLEQIYGRKYEFSSKYTEKGTEQENDGIELLKKAGYLTMFSKKNVQRFENDFITGEPDIIEPEFILDVKCSYEFFTFPFFDEEIKTKAYIYQLQAYMELAGKQKAMLAYCLVDTPIDLIEKEVFYKTNDKELTIKQFEEIEDKVFKQHQFSDISIEKKIKIFNIERDYAFIEKVYQRVKECREYIKTLSV